MVGTSLLKSVAVADIELDRTNPRIQKFLEMYDEEPGPEQFRLALGAGGEESDSSATFDKLRNSILTNHGIIQPVIVNRTDNGRLVCIEGNTRVAIYKQFIEENVKGEWTQIPALVYENMDQPGIDAIRLQVHLVGTRPWDPYSKAKYLHHLYTQQLLAPGQIVAFCGGREKEVNESIHAYIDMERHYRPLVDDTSFDTTRFSGFIELQKPNIKDSILSAKHTLDEFASWIKEEKLYPLAHVRYLPRILKNPRAHDIFLKKNSKEAITALDRPDVGKALSEANLAQLARALSQALTDLPWGEAERIKSDPAGEVGEALADTFSELQRLLAFIERA